MAVDLAIAEERCVCGSPVVGYSYRDSRPSRWCAKHNLWASQVRHRYKCDDETIAALLVLKEDGCAICPSHHLLSIDHCHETMEIRGWLCRKCNSALGFFNDDPERLRLALKYLEGSI